MLVMFDVDGKKVLHFSEMAPKTIKFWTLRWFCIFNETFDADEDDDDPLDHWPLAVSRLGIPLSYPSQRFVYTICTLQSFTHIVFSEMRHNMYVFETSLQTITHSLWDYTLCAAFILRIELFFALTYKHLMMDRLYCTYCIVRWCIIGSVLFI